MRALRAAGHACPMAIDFDVWQFEQLSAIHNQPIATRANGYEGLNAELVFNRGFVPMHDVTNMKRWLAPRRRAASRAGWHLSHHREG